MMHGTKYRGPEHSNKNLPLGPEPGNSDCECNMAPNDPLKELLERGGPYDPEFLFAYLTGYAGPILPGISQPLRFSTVGGLNVSQDVIVIYKPCNRSGLDINLVSGDNSVGLSENYMQIDLTKKGWENKTIILGLKRLMEIYKDTVSESIIPPKWDSRRSNVGKIN